MYRYEVKTITAQNDVKIDKALCVGCSSCAKICPQRAIEVVDQEAKHDPFRCFLCGHCSAVCPSNAVTIASLHHIVSSFADDKSPHYSQKTSELVKLMAERRSCRAYKEDEISRSILDDLVKIAITAPSGTNSQGWNFTILPTREDVLYLGEAVAGFFRRLNRRAENGFLRAVVKLFGGDRLGNYYRNHYGTVQSALQEWDETGTDRLFHGATAAILVTGKQSSSCPAEDALLATQNILLAAHSMELGSCLIGFAVEAMRRDASINKMVGIPDNENIYSVIGIGMPAVHFVRSAGRKKIVPRIFQVHSNKSI